MIRFDKVTKTYPRAAGATALRDVSFRLGKGEFAFLTGPSGAGKSTILKLLYMAERPTSGEVRISGYSSAKIKQREVAELIGDELGLRLGVEAHLAAGADLRLHRVGPIDAPHEVEVRHERQGVAAREHRDPATTAGIGDGDVEHHRPGVRRHSVDAGDLHFDDLTGAERADMAIDDAGAVTTDPTVASGYCVTGSGNGKGSGAVITFNSEKGGVGSTACP